MKVTKGLLGLIFVVITHVFFLCETGLESTVSADNSWKNFYGIVWVGTAIENARYAKQMGHDYIAIQLKTVYKGKQDYANLNFYFIDPKNGVFDSFGYDRFIDTNKTYSQAEQDFYNRHMVWKSYAPFPDNLASGWFQGTSTKFSAMWDFQQEAVIDVVVEECIRMFHDYEDASLPFTFAGYMDDEPSLNGIFYRWEENSNSVTSLSYWTGTESGLLHDTITHEYATHQDGKAAFFKKLRERMQQEFPGSKWIVEPYSMYWGWINVIKSRTDKEALTPDMMVQENSSVEFVDDDRIFNSGVTITKEMVGTTQPNNVNEYENRLYAANAGINGAWYNWFGRFGGTGNMPNFNSITEVYPRLKLVRCVPNWDNLNGLGTSTRSWDGTVYTSQKNNQPWSGISPYIIYSRHWKRPDELFVCALGTDSPTLGTATWSSKYFIKNVYATNAYFEEAGDGSSDWNIDNKSNKAWIKEGILSGSSTDRGKVYIFELGTRTANFIGNNKRVTIGNKQKNISY